MKISWSLFNKDLITTIWIICWTRWCWNHKAIKRQVFNHWLLMVVLRQKCGTPLQTVWGTGDNQAHSIPQHFKDFFRLIRQRTFDWRCPSSKGISGDGSNYTGADSTVNNFIKRNPDIKLVERGHLLWIEIFPWKNFPCSKISKLN